MIIGSSQIMFTKWKLFSGLSRNTFDEKVVWFPVAMIMDSSNKTLNNLAQRNRKTTFNLFIKIVLFPSLLDSI